MDATMQLITILQSLRELPCPPSDEENLYLDFSGGLLNTHQGKCNKNGTRHWCAIFMTSTASSPTGQKSSKTLWPLLLH